jgi:hypothetical protein
VNDFIAIARRADGNEVVEALQSAVAVLGAEFSDTVGSGHDALVKCRRALDYLKPKAPYRTMQAGG